MRWILYIPLWLGLAFNLNAQGNVSERSTIYVLAGSSGANIREFNEMLSDKGISNLRGGYSTLGIGYQYRLSDFILGFELYQNTGANSYYRDYIIDNKSTRFYMNVGYSLTEEGKFHLIHYMSLGAGYVNFEMLKDQRKVDDLGAFLQQPAQGFILRERNIHKGTQNFGGFLTEIGFQFGYDFSVPGLEETVGLLGKFGYSFSPFEGAWEMNDITFDNLQSGAFFRLGAGISMPDQNLFFPDAGIGVHFFYGYNFTNPDGLNDYLVNNGLAPFKDRPNNLGMKIIGENRRWIYSVDIFNIANSGIADENREQTLNSVRLYGNYGYQLYKMRNLELGVLAGLGYGNIRYTLTNVKKPDFPILFEEPDYDGYLKSRGIMGKSEVMVAYAFPVFNKMFRIVTSAHAGYELPLSTYKLGELNMSSYMAGPYLQLGVGLRP
tara:strand:- start:4554 stop:5861 length:1308 start_codon:yes stop_codon:yes gene_type:complete